MIRLKLTLLMLFAAYIKLLAGDISLCLDYYPETPFVITVKQGTVNDTIHVGVLDQSGRGEFPFPVGYAGMATLKAGNANFEFIINGECLIIHCAEEYIHGGNVTFEHSQENEALQSWFYEQSVRKQKIGLLSETEKFYEEKDPFCLLLKKEKDELIQQQEEFEEKLESSSLYAARFMEFHSFLNQEIASLVWADSLKKVETRDYIKNNLDINNLFTSGLWFNILNGLLVLYEDESPYHQDFVTDMSLILNKTTTDYVYATLAENLFSICESMGWNDQEEQLAYYLVNDGRIKEPTGRFKMLMTLFKLIRGSKAPVLSNGQELHNTLLVFYESGCSSCENEMEQLKKNYGLLKSKGYEVVSVSTDMDELVFQNSSADFPWKNKYCDLQGFKGKDSVGYGVIGTPTFYLIDNEGVILGRYARVQDTGLLN